MDIRKGLNLDSHPKHCETGEWAFAKNIMYDDLLKDIVNETGNMAINFLEDQDPKQVIWGVIKYSIGHIIFTNSHIWWYENNRYMHSLSHRFFTEHGCTLENPIRGITTYNWNKELIVIFSDGNSSTSKLEPQCINLSRLMVNKIWSYPGNSDLILNTIHPKIEAFVESGGTLLHGSYTIAIRYINEDDNEARFSPTIPMLYVFDDCSTNSPGKISSQKIILNIKHYQNKIYIDGAYKRFQIAIIYDDGIAKTVRYLPYEDVNFINDFQRVEISNITSHIIGSIDDVTINKAFYKRVESYSSVYNELQIGNIKIPDILEITMKLKEVANELSINSDSYIISAASTKEFNQKRIQHFQNGEVYAFYISALDKKGNIISTVPITTNKINGLNLSRITNNNKDVLYKFEETVNIVENRVTVTLPNINIVDVESFIISSAVRNLSNSRIITQGYMMADMKGVSIKNGALWTPLSPCLKCGEKGEPVGNGRINYYSNNINPDASLFGWLRRAEHMRNRYNIVYDISRYIIDEAMLDVRGNDALLNFRLYSFELLYNHFNLHKCKLNILDVYKFDDIDGTKLDIPWFWLWISAGDYKVWDTFNRRDNVARHPDTKLNEGIASGAYVDYFKSKLLESTDRGSSYFMEGINVDSGQYVLNNNSNLSNIGGESFNKLVLRFEGDAFYRYLEETVEIPIGDGGNDGDGGRIVNWKARIGAAFVTGVAASLGMLIPIGWLAGIFGENVDPMKHGKALYKALTPNRKAGEVISGCKGGFTRVNIINDNENYYSNLKAEDLQIISPVIHKSDKLSFSLKGDTFYGIFYTRITSYFAEWTVGERRMDKERNDDHYAYIPLSYNLFDEARKGKANMHDNVDSSFGDGGATNYPFSVTPSVWIIGLPIESKYNIPARYSEGATFQQQYMFDGTSSGLFDTANYPETKDNYINTVDGFGYNKTYNSLNNINLISCTLESEMQQTDLYYRIARSHNQGNETKSIQWRYFDVGSYYDMPAKFGHIVKLHGIAKELYIQQERALHLAAIKDMLTSEGGGTAIGSADIFSRIPQEIAASPDGYIGCSNYFSTEPCELGLIVIDAEQSKIFLVTGEKAVDELSTKRIERWLVNRLSSGNPFQGEGAIPIYDKVNRRILITTKDEKNALTDVLNRRPSKNWTLSYDLIGKRWLSFHDYVPHYGWYNRLGTYMFQNAEKNNIFINIRSNRGAYFNKKYPCVIQIVYNEAPFVSKLIESIKWDTTLRVKPDGNTIYLYEDTITNIMLHNDTQCTGWMPVQSYRKKNENFFDNETGIYKTDSWYWNNMRDIVKNPRTNIMMQPTYGVSIGLLDPQNPSVPQGVVSSVITNIDNLDPSKMSFDKSRFICNYIVITMEFESPYYDPKTDKLLPYWSPYVAGYVETELILHNIDVNIQKDNRIGDYNQSNQQR